MKNPLMNNYGQRDLAFTHGEGCYLYDTDGTRYLDAIGGIAVNVLGHGHAGFARAVSEQVGTLVHVSNLYRIPEQEELGRVLCKRSGMQQAFFCNSGTESIEAAIKIARMYGHNNKVKKPTILVTEGAFHGRSMGALAATWNKAYKTPFKPMLPGFVRVPYNDVKAVKAAVKKHADNLVAILVEPAQGERGVRVPAPDYLEQLRAVCDKRKLLLMLDEVQTGNGRSGKYFAFQHGKLLPDVLCTSKGLGNGFPVGATLVAGRAYDTLGPGSHGTTFGGSPLASRAALAVYEALDKEKLVANAAARGKQIVTGLRKSLAGNKLVNDIRGLGLLIGVELDRPCGELVKAARAKGVLLNVASGHIIRLAPPLPLDAEQADTIIRVVTDIVQEFSQ